MEIFLGVLAAVSAVGSVAALLVVGFGPSGRVRVVSKYVGVVLALTLLVSVAFVINEAIADDGAEARFPQTYGHTQIKDLEMTVNGLWKTSDGWLKILVEFESRQKSVSPDVFKISECYLELDDGTHLRLDESNDLQVETILPGQVYSGVLTSGGSFQQDPINGVLKCLGFDDVPVRVEMINQLPEDFFP